MSEEEICEVLREFLEREVIDSPGAELRPGTPLLELGILNSFTTVRLTSFIGHRFGVEVPPEEMVGRNFANLESVSKLVSRLVADRGEDARVPSDAADSERR